MFKSSLEFKDNFCDAGNFSISTYPLCNHNPYDEKVIYEDHNQVQRLGANVLARLLCMNAYGRCIPVFSNIKASTFLNSGSKVPQPTPLEITDIQFPGEPNHLDYVVEAFQFYTDYSTNLYDTQYARCIGTFEDIPPRTLDNTDGVFYHFGLFLSSFKDVEEYMFAYKYIPTGIIYPEGFGLKVRWDIRLSA